MKIDYNSDGLIDWVRMSIQHYDAAAVTDL